MAGAAMLAASPLRADDLRQALELAYRTNPQLEAARAQQRAVDEGVPIARSAQLPSIAGTAAYTEFVKKSSDSSVSPDRAFSAGVDVSVPIFAGGAIKNSIRAAETRVKAGQQDLRGTESDVFTQVVAAYMDVILGQAIVGLNRSNIQVLDVNLQATRDRFQIGDLTRTDVAQSGARLAVARSQTRTAESNLIAARERYIQVVGKPPVNLQPPPPLPGLPATAEEAVQTALESNPDLEAARQRSRAAGYDTNVAGAGRLPRVSVFTGADYSDYLGSLGGPSIPPGSISQRSTAATAGVRATIPIFQGGLPAAQERQAQAREGATLENEIAIERQIVAGVRTAFAQWKSANDVITSSQTGVDAATLSLEGVRAENTVGNRTILDILNAEQELLNAQVQLVTARRNAYVAGFNLLATMGKADALDLGLDGGPLYDPMTNYNRVKGKIWDWAKDPDPVAKSTRTVDTPAQDGSIPPS
ncbi:TolC family outer membrane protein [Parablastomonas sp. CN1-191]|uniref:TolC family outer membrane protein n=1 Tax=Parablastomonas sp. CN1-191 TaxID=3400908 RepID=UPI003BF8A2EB